MSEEANIQDEFEVTENITLRLENGVTVIYINGKRFNTCKRLMLNIPVEKMSSFDEIESIDEASEKPAGEFIETEKEFIISPEVEFWAHCSNLQVWVEHNYDTRLLHSTLAFPLLEKLSQIGAPRAKIRLREEISRRLESGYPSVVEFLYADDYVYRYLTHEEVFGILLEMDEAQLIMELEKIIDEPLSHSLKILEPNTFTINKKRVTQINLQGSNLKKISRIVNRFKFLKKIIINEIEYKDINDSISKIPSNATEMPRITVSLDLFDETIIRMMAQRRHRSKSETVRFILSQWISSNSTLLREQYEIDTEYIRKELETEDLDNF